MFEEKENQNLQLGMTTFEEKEPEKKAPIFSQIENDGYFGKPEKYDYSEIQMPEKYTYDEILLNEFNEEDIENVGWYYIPKNNGREANLIRKKDKFK